MRKIKIRWNKLFLFVLVLPVIFVVVIFSRLWASNTVRSRVTVSRKVQSKNFAISSISNKFLKNFKTPVANACGLAPSSCVECHNGSMSEKDVGPIHHVHRPVKNITCITCHKGNDFAIAKGMAHTHLIANPLHASKYSCEACHSSDLSQIVKKGIAKEKMFYAAHPNAPKIKG